MKQFDIRDSVFGAIERYFTKEKKGEGGEEERGKEEMGSQIYKGILFLSPVLK